MKLFNNHLLIIVLLSLLFTGCEVGITPLEHAANEMGIETTNVVDSDGDSGAISIVMPENIGDADVYVELYGEGSEHFSVMLDKTSYGYIGEVIVNPDFIVYEDTVFNFSARTVVDGQKLCAKEIQKTVDRTEVAPLAINKNINLNEDSSTTISLEATDKNNDFLTYSIIQNPTHGKVTLNGSTVMYYPNSNYFGSDTFSYIANDGRSDSNIATVNLIIVDTPDEVPVEEILKDTIPPVISLNGVSAISITLGMTYVDAGATAVDNRDGNISVIVSGSVNTSTVGRYEIIYTSTDTAGNATTEIRVVTVLELKVLDTIPPVITLNGIDVNLSVGDVYIDAGATANDNIDGNITAKMQINNQVDTNTVGSYTVTYNVTDSAGNVAPEVIRTVIVQDTIAPVITLIGGDVTLAVGATYTDAGASASDNLDGDITSRIVISGDNIDTAVPGNYIIRYDVNDSAGNVANQQTRVVTVTNNKPVAVGSAYEMFEDTNLTRPLQGSDVDSGAVLTYSIVDDSSNGSVGITGNIFTYTPDPDYFGTDSFTFEVRDEFNATSNAVSINITIHDVAEPNTTPVSEDMNVSMGVNTPMITFGLNASDADGNTLTYSIVSSPAFGTLTVDDNLTGQVTYNRGTYTGNTSFTYKVNDGTIDSNITTVYIRSNVPNTPPIAYGQSVNLDVSGAPMIMLDANDTDIGDTLTYRIGTPPSYGTISLIGNQIIYSPNLNYTGNDSFTFIANDGKDDSNEALVYIEVGNMQLTSYLFNWCEGKDQELWQTDGTKSGTGIVKNIRSEGSAIPQSFVKIKNTYFFMANDGVHGRELWKSQGTADSTVLVKDIKTKGNGHSNPHNLIDINGTLFFAAKDGVKGIELWKSDGTTLGTKMVKNINKRGHSKPENLTNVNGILYFTAGDGVNGRELWRSNGTIEGTNQVNDINSNGSSNPKYLTNINGVLYFSADDGGTIGLNDLLTQGLGRELWYYNTNISDIASGFTNRGYFDIFDGNKSGNPTNLYNYNGTLVFSAEDKIFGRELWISDGTAGGTTMHSNFAGTDGFFGDNRAEDSNPHSFTIVGTALYFSAAEAFYSGDSLRKIDNTSSKIESVFYIDSNAEETFIANPKNLTQSNGALLFSTYAKSVDQNGNTTDEWIRFWKASGDQAQREILFHPADSIRDMSDINDVLYFVVTEKNDLDEFWRYDGNNLELLTAGCRQ